MSAMNFDLLTRLTTGDPTYADSALGTTANSQSSFSDYLQRAQTQSAEAAPASGGWTTAESSDGTGLQTPTAASAAPQADTGPADRGPRKTGDGSPTGREDAAPAASSQRNSSPPQTAGSDAPTASQDNRYQGGHDSGSRSPNQDVPQPSNTTRQDDAHKVKKGDGAAVIVDINMVAAAANAAAGGNGTPSSDPRAQAATAPVNAKQSALAGQTAVNVSQTVLKTAANGQAVAAQPATTQAAPAASESPGPQEGPAPETAATTVDSSAATTRAKPGDRTVGQAPTAGQGLPAGTDPVAAAAAVMPVNPSANAAATPPADPKPSQPAAASGIRAASADPVPDAAPAATAPDGDEMPQIPDVPAARGPRAKSALESLSPADSNNGTNTTAAQSGNSASSATAAVPQTALHGTTADGGPSTAPAADAGSSQADHVRFVERVEQAFQDLGGQSGSVRLRLSPPELGSLHIEINVTKGEMTARVEAETPAARNALLDNLPALRERLAQHDIKVQRFDVDLMDRSRGGMSNQSSQYQNPSPQSGGGASVRGPVRSGSELPGTVAAAPSPPLGGGGHLNVVV
jgi:flagellar hook-length control protein FliK